VITQGELCDLLKDDNTIVDVICIRQVSDGWEYLIKTNFVFPVFVIGWTDGKYVQRKFGCYREENAERAWAAKTEAAHV
jgi:hypothetical protein